VVTRRGGARHAPCLRTNTNTTTSIFGSVIV